MQHYFQEDTLPSHANFYVAAKVHSDDAVEEEQEDEKYDPSDEDSDEEGDSEDDRVRSLTRQLAETAVGVREMSKQLGEWCSVAERRRRCHAGLAS